MPSTVTTTLSRSARRLWWLLDATRRTLLNLLLLALLAGIAWLLWRQFAGPPALQDKTVLVVQLSGRLVEQGSFTGLRDTLRQRVSGEGQEAQTQLRDVLRVLDAAAKDPDVSMALLLADDLTGGGLPKLREVAAAIERFKASGKPVVAWGSGYDQRQYYLAAHASEVWLHPMGTVMAEGYGRHRNYYRELFDKVGVSANVVRAGRFKNAAETFSDTGPSPETLESEGALWGSLWATWTGNVERARKLPAGSVMQAIDSLPASLVAAGGDVARWALERKWVDGLKTRDQMRDALIARSAKDERGGVTSFRQVHAAEYLARLKPERGGDAIGVVVAAGPISDGEAGPGRIGGRSTAELIRRAREDKAVKAVVLRVDSPGGSAFGSELVRRELELLRQAGKPVVVSMSDLAASGGYWISMAADEVIADEATITGSIGVVAMLPTARGAMDKLGVRTGGVTTTWLAGAFDPRRGVDPRFAELVKTGVDRVYRDFTTLTATARRSTPEKIDAVAQGRVWSGRHALERGLVDRLGGFDDALKAAAQRAKLAEGQWHPRWIEARPSRLAVWLQRLGIEAGLDDAGAVGGAGGMPAEVNGTLLALGLPVAAFGDAAQELGWISEVMQQRRPYAAMVHCLCSAP
jgi:protease-4